MSRKPIFLFYEEPDPDRWFPGDRFPRRWIRRLIRGKPQPGGVMRWFLNLKTGMELAKLPYRLNDYRGLRNTPGATACVIGKPHVVEKIPKGHPILFGPGIAAHPLENEFWSRSDFRLIVISCAWFREMYKRDLPCAIETTVWPAGIEVDLWAPPPQRPKGKILLYDKIRWDHDEYESTLIEPILEKVRDSGYDIISLRYGSYQEEDFRTALQSVSAMVFLCEHETQGFAYLQTLSSGVPIIAWDRGGYWRDPSMFPDKVKFKPVSSVPYFDERCGVKFENAAEFEESWPQFQQRFERDEFRPRDYVEENFNLAEQARKYVQIVEDTQKQTA